MILEKRKEDGSNKAHLIKLKADVKEILERYRDKRKEEFLAVKSCLEREAATIIRLVLIYYRLDDENGVVREIENLKELQSNINEEVLREK